MLAELFVKHLSASIFDQLFPGYYHVILDAGRLGAPVIVVARIQDYSIEVLRREFRYYHAGEFYISQDYQGARNFANCSNY